MSEEVDSLANVRPQVYERFNAKSDPRFKQMRMKDRKIKIDKRFSKIFTDDEFSISTPIDPFGRKKSKKKIDEDMHKFYEVGESEKSTQGEESSLDSEEPFEWNEESDDDDSQTYKEEKCTFKDPIWENNPIYRIGISEGDATSRLSLMGLDWDNINADDIYVVLSSFLSPSKVLSVGNTNNKLIRVSIYPSNFGKERMEYEEVHGPTIQSTRQKDVDSGEEEDLEAIRRYQVEKSLYYYAVIECADVNSAIKLANELDGMEADFCIDSLDVRFVPDDLIEFPYPPISVSSCIPTKYKPPDCFRSALKHSKPLLIWDDTPLERVKFLRKKFTPEELLSNDFDAYLASDIESENEYDETKNISKAGLGGDLEENLDEIRHLLLGDVQNLFDSNTNSKDNDEYDPSIYEMKKNMRQKSKCSDILEIEFKPQLEDLAIDLITKGTQKWEDETICKDNVETLTPWQTYLKKKKQKRKERKLQVREKIREQRLQREQGSLNIRHMDGELDVNKNQIIDSNSNILYNKGNNINDDDEDRHFDMKNLRLLEKSDKKVKSKKRQNLIKVATSESIQIGFSGSIHDPRVSEIFTNPDFAIDPTNPLYKPTNFNETLLKEKRKQKIKRDNTPKLLDNTNQEKKSDLNMIPDEVKDSFTLLSNKKTRKY
ncbi:uncharacterized protein CMU_039990 [Cryptosporidium muris RN66]|uniref:Uncharacterized protein n=1 Tax=Cryptosporidium muris (strain RN66) TaxID=441375 RepID=B6A9N9_CRYMR|nr:uncharacterized protein CMU_039990 [Cryptosporidium muris RN66]EEA04930.1 hypothetical protein, conserved [Cryptosporidium muris RN66]|eukprot:XP_002139279.1 hypothetical protein [Cryptosporidium muris RN66]